MGYIFLRLLPFLLLLLVFYLLWQLLFKKATFASLLESGTIWYIIAAIAICIVGGGLTLFFMDDSPKQPHSYTPTKIIDGKIVPGKAE